VLRWLLLALVLALAACGGDAPPPSAPPKARPLARELSGAARAIEERRFAEGRALAEAHLAQHPEDGQAAFLIGLAHTYADNHGAARPWLERAREREPGLVAVHALLGACLFRLGELADARQSYATYVALVPDDPKGHYGVGLIELDETRLAEAAERFRRALALFDALERNAPREAAARRAERGECHARLGEVHFALGDLAAARGELERATTLAPENISAFYTLSLVYRRLGEEALAGAAAARYEAARQALVAGQGQAR
jgi:tetratricopeptide (TPR) repeat protein